MDSAEFWFRMQYQNWVENYSPAGIASLRSGGADRRRFQEGCAYYYLSALEAREKEWSRVNGRKSKGFIQNIKFVDIELTTEGKAAFKTWDWTDDDTIGFIERMGSDGYKIGARYDSANGAWLASLTCSDAKSPNYEYCLSARGKSFLHAFAVVAYKDLVLLENNWKTKLDPDDNDAGWG